MKRVTEPLSAHTWLKIGGTAEIAIPESKSELIDILNECHEKGRSYRILGNGSNLVVSDRGIDELVIKTTEACIGVKFNEKQAEVGASTMVPQFISECIQHDLGGYEYLYSVPGTIGGAIFMNAGRGKKYDETISDYLVSVEVFDNGRVREIPSTALNFGHRHSTFQDHSDWVILSATFDLPTQSAEEGRQKAQERMKKVNERERSKPNAGSVFKSGARLPLHKVPPNGLSIGGARFVARNRICNDGEATFRDVIWLITLGRLLNQLVPPFRAPEVELEIWE